MCMMVYIASDYQLPTQPWDEAHPRFHVTDLIERDSPVRLQFSKTWVYYVGSHEGCGCGFQYGQYPQFEDEATARAAQMSRHLFEEFLLLGLQHQHSIELFACWDGDQASAPEFREQISPLELLRNRTFFRGKELVVVSNHPA